LAEQNLVLAISILQQLSTADPSNIHYREEVLYRRIMLARLLGDTGQLEPASSFMKELELEFEALGELTEWTATSQTEYIELVLALADVEAQLGNMASANVLLQDVIQLQLSSSDPQLKDIFDTQRLVLARYHWWLLNKNDNFDNFPVIPEFHQASTSEFRSCLEAESAARMYVIEDEKDKAAGEVAYLGARGYADPGFIRFCQKHELCDL